MKFGSNLFSEGIFADTYVKVNTHVPVTSGGLLFSGAALTTLITGTYSFIGEGSINFSGQTQSNQAYGPIVFGSINFSGNAAINILVDISATGGFNFSGSADNSFTVNIISTGSVNFLPSHELNIVRDYLQSGSVILSGITLTEQTIEYTYTPIISGQIEFSGITDYVLVPKEISVFTHVSSGGIELSGLGGILTLFNVIGSGKVEFAGISDTDNPTNHQEPEIIEFNLTINRHKELDVVIDREFDAELQITRSIDFNHVL